jgi:hypothetical protein
MPRFNSGVGSYSVLPVHKRSDGERLVAAERGAQLQRPPQPTGKKNNNTITILFSYKKIEEKAQANEFQAQNNMSFR